MGEQVNGGEPDPTEGHSPLPWDYETHVGVIVYAGDDTRVVLSYEPDAALIVREVNEAPKLRAEIERLRTLVRSAFLEGYEYGEGFSSSHRKALEWWAGSDARAVLNPEEV